MCTYKKTSNEPCEECPRVMSALHRCDFLKEDLEVESNKTQNL